MLHKVIDSMPPLEVAFLHHSPHVGIRSQLFHIRNTANFRLVIPIYSGWHRVSRTEQFFGTFMATMLDLLQLLSFKQMTSVIITKLSNYKLTSTYSGFQFINCTLYCKLLHDVTLLGPTYNRDFD